MTKLYLIFGVFLFSVHVNTGTVQDQKSVSPRDLEDEAREILENLRSTVRGRIFTSFNEIDVEIREIYYFRNERLEEAEIAINQEYETINSQLTTLKDLAQSAGENIDVCLNNNGPLLEQLPYDIIDSLLECLAFANVELTIIQNEARYRIDILINEVHVYEYQLDLCAGDFLCISSIVTEIELAMIGIPQKIDIEVQRAADLSAELKVLIQQCTDNKVAQFNTEAGIFFNEIATCVNNILS